MVYDIDTGYLLLFTTAQVQIWQGSCEKVAYDLSLGGGFHQALQFPPPLTFIYLLLSVNMAEKVKLHIRIN